MKGYSTGSGDAARVTWESLEAFAREGIQELLQKALEEEVSELLRRERCERGSGADEPRGYRNGYGELRRLSMSCGTFTVRPPRVRDLEERADDQRDRVPIRRSKVKDATAGKRCERAGNARTLSWESAADRPEEVPKARRSPSPCRGSGLLR